MDHEIKKYLFDIQESIDSIQKYHRNMQEASLSLDRYSKVECAS